MSAPAPQSKIRRIAGFLAILATLAALMLLAGAPPPTAAQPAQQPDDPGFTLTRSPDGASATFTWAPAANAEIQWVATVQRLDPDELAPGDPAYDPDTIQYPGMGLDADANSLEITGLHPARAYAYAVATYAPNDTGAKTWTWVQHYPANPASCYHAGAVPEPDDSPGLLGDCRTLLGLRDALQGDAVRPLDWSVSRPIADWDGITVSDTPPRVTDINMDNRRLTGVIPPALAQLDALRILDLRDNSLGGAIPPQLGNLASLEHLVLYKNDLEGAIPPELGSLASLQILNLRNNHLGADAPIPSALGRLQNLEFLSLADNEIHGEIPPELGNLANLESLSLEDNLFHGPIPRSWATSPT